MIFVRGATVHKRDHGSLLAIASDPAVNLLTALKRDHGNLFKMASDSGSQPVNYAPDNKKGHSIPKSPLLITIIAAY